MFIGLSAFNITGFNRTFMELKFKVLTRVNRAKMFQSYLYGIEIYGNCCPKEQDVRFQSYLYGIEIDKKD